MLPQPPTSRLWEPSAPALAGCRIERPPTETLATLAPGEAEGVGEEDDTSCKIEDCYFYNGHAPSTDCEKGRDLFKRASIA